MLGYSADCPLEVTFLLAKFPDQFPEEMTQLVLE